MNTDTISALCFSGLLLAAVGCQTVNRVYEQDTGEIAAVPGPPAADAGSITPSAEVEFVDDATLIDGADAQDAMLPGETETIEPLPEPEPVPLQTYTIQKGDSFWKIAKSVYGDPTRIKDLEAANPGVDPKKLTIGDEIVLPE